MSYQIYYDRAYVRVGEQFIPLVNSGSNNCFEVGFGGRERCEKSWNVMNWKRSDRFIFSESEIREIARDYDEYNQECGMMFKSRNRCFGPGEMERWIINGMRRAYTVEEYVSFGNGFFALDYSAPETKSWKKHPFKTTDEMLRILDDLKDAKSLELKLEYNRDVFRPKVTRPPKRVLRTDNLAEYYVLKGEYEERTIYFVRFTRRGGIAFHYERPYNPVKPFQTEKDAMKYLTKYHTRLVERYKFAPEKISKAI